MSTRDRLLAAGVVTGVLLALAVMFWDDVACSYAVAREGRTIPVLTGKTLDEAVTAMPDCIDLEVANPSPSGSDRGRRIVDQQPGEPPTVVNSPTTVTVTLEPGR